MQILPPSVLVLNYEQVSEWQMFWSDLVQQLKGFVVLNVL